MRFDFKPRGRQSSLFRFYWLRNGELELFREYDWVPRGNLADFERSSERAILFEHGAPVGPPEGGDALPADADAIRQEGEWLYSLIQAQEASE